MKTILTVDNQTVFDIAAQYYGTQEAVWEILSLNPSIENDIDFNEFQLDLPVKANSLLTINENK